MKITLVRSMARSAVFELVNSGCYRAPAPYTVSLDGATVCEGDTNVFSLYSLEPGRSYTLAVTLDGVTGTLCAADGASIAAAVRALYDAPQTRDRYRQALGAYDFEADNRQILQRWTALL